MEDGPIWILTIFVQMVKLSILGETLLWLCSKNILEKSNLYLLWHDSLERPFFRKRCSSLSILKFYPLLFCLIIVLLNTVLQNSFELLHYHFSKSGHLGVSIYVLIFVFNEGKRFSFCKSFQMQIKINTIWKLMKQNWNLLKCKKKKRTYIKTSWNDH